MAATINAPPGSYTVSRVATNAVFATINNSGQIAGTTPAAYGYSLFLWTPLAANGTVGTLVDLGNLPLLGANLDALVGINGRGQVVGTTSFQNPPAQMVLWSPDTANGASGSFSQIPIAPGTGTARFGIDNFGQVTGLSQVWTPSPPNGTSGTIFTDGRFDPINAINAFGQTISGFPQAYLFTPTAANGNSGTFTPIALPGAISTNLIAINNNGTIMGVSCIGSSYINCQNQTFLWTPNSPNGATGTAAPIPIPQGFSSISVIVLNNNGQMLGELDTTPFLYSGGTFYDLSAVVPQGARLTAFNDLGQIVFLSDAVYLISPASATTPPPPGAVPVNIASQPPGLAFVVTGANCSAGSYTTPHAVNWTPGSNCTVAFVSPNSTQGRVRYAFANWQDGPISNSRVIVAPAQTATYTANFSTEYPLYPIVSPLGAGTITNAGWYDAGVTATITATPAAGYRLAGWADQAVAIPGTNSATVTMTAAEQAAAIFVPLPPALPNTYAVTQIATNSAAASGKPINNFGQVVGSTTTGPGVGGGAPPTTALLWTPATANANVGSVTDVGGFPSDSAANSINDLGEVVGTSDAYAFLWSPTAPNSTSGGATSFLGAAAIGTTTIATAINSFGEIGGVDEARGGFFWVPSSANGLTGTMTRLGPTSPAGINDLGQAILVNYESPELFTPALAYGTSGTFTPIVSASGLILPIVGINNQGTVLGTNFVWTPNAPNATTGTVATIPLPAGASAIAAAALNSAGDVVGALSLGGGLTTPFLCTGGTVYDLGVLSGVPTGSSAVGINDHGQIVLNAASGVYLVSPTTPPPNPGPNDVPVTIVSTPSGRAFTVTGSGCRPGGYLTPQTLSWTPGSSCMVTFLSPHSTEVGTRYLFSSWTDGPTANPRVIATPGQASTYTATFGTQYFVTVLVSPAGTGTVAGAVWYNANSTATLTPEPVSGFAVVSWAPASVTQSGSTLSVQVTAPLTVSIFFAALIAAPPVSYTVTQIVPSGSAGGLNNFGQVVGAVAGSPKTAFLWTPSTASGTTGSLITLPALPLAGASDNVAAAINDRGQVVGNTLGNTGLQPFLWTPNTPNGTSGSSVAFLGGLAGSTAGFINAFGQIAGGNYIQDFLWTPSAPNGTAGTVSPGIVSGYLSGLNAFGEILFNQFVYTGGDQMPDGYAQAYLFVPTVANGSTGTVGTFGSQTAVSAINDHDAILGPNYLYTPAAPGGGAGTTTPLPLPVGYSGISANALNNGGQIIGSLAAPDTDSKPFLYAGGALYDLSQVSGLPAGAGPIAINDHGQILLSVSGGVYLLTPQVPTPVSASPASGSAFGQTMVFTFSDPHGWQDLNIVNILIASALDGRGACYLAYNQPLNTLYLVDDAGTALSGIPMNGSGSIGNSQCTVSGAGSSALGAGNTLSLTLNLTFQPAFAGNKIMYLAARNLALNNSGWQSLGTWNVPGGSTFPSAVSVSPASGAGSAQTFTFTFADTKGYQDLGVVNILINSFLDGRQSCYLAYSQPLHVLYLVNDAGTGLTNGLSWNRPGSIGNSQCTVNAAGSSATGNGNSLTLILNVGFTAGFNGSRVIYMAARDSTDANNSGWQPLGSWTVE